MDGSAEVSATGPVGVQGRRGVGESVVARRFPFAFAVFALVTTASPFARALGAERPLPADPGSLPLPERKDHYVLRGHVTPRLPTPRALDAALLEGGATPLLAPFAPELWSCTRRRGAAVDASVAAALPEGLRDACFYEGFETVTVEHASRSTGFALLRTGGYVWLGSLRRRTVDVRFHGLALRDGRLPRTVARTEDALVLDDAATALETARPVMPPPAEFLETVAEGERWIYLDRDDQVLVAYVGARPVMVTLVSTGRAGFPTRLGEFRIVRKLPLGSMRDYDPAHGDRPYHITDIPDIQYFVEGQAFHGVFWHDGFGTRRSHGCVNLAAADARWLYEFTDDGTGDESAPASEGTITDPPAPWHQSRHGRGTRVFVYSAERGLDGRHAPTP